ncbi:MAG: YggT family protein [Fibrobacter sp.]|jgi:YggT family protein|nr:YggT family protein [Fibrobacter sp.]
MAYWILLIFRIYEFIVLARVIISWVHVDPYNPVVMWIHRLTEPLLDPIRRLVPPGRTGLDFSPLILLLLLELLERFLLRSLYTF